MYRSIDQYIAYKSLVERSSHIIHITRTGGGKTLPLMLALKRWEPRTKLLVLEPFVAVYDDMKKRFDAVGLSAQVLDNATELDEDCRVYIVSINTFSMDRCHTRILHLAQRGHLGAVFLDECDGLVSNEWREHYDWAYNYALQLPDTALVFATATMPPAYTDVWLDKLGIKSAVYPGEVEDAHSEHWRHGPSPFRMVRHRVTDRFNISYRAIPYDPDNCDDSSSTLYQELRRYIRANYGRAMVFTTSPAMTEQIADWLGELGETETGIIHGKIGREERRLDLTAFVAAERGIIIGTKAAYYGIDVPSVRLVVFVIEHDHYTPNLVEFAQGSGRGGRNGKRAVCIVFYPNFTSATQAKPHSSWSKPKYDFNGAAQFVGALKHHGCVREVLSGHLDGWKGMNCIAMEKALEPYADGDPDVTHVVPCSRCAILSDSGKRYLPVPPQKTPPAQRDDRGRRGDDWGHWVPGLRRPEPLRDVPRVLWGNVPLPPVSPAMKKLTGIMQNGKSERMLATSIVHRILSKIHSVQCLGCLTFKGTSANHVTTDCKEKDWWPFYGATSRVVSAPTLHQGAFKTCWSRFLTNQKCHGVCFACFLPQNSSEFHDENQACRYRKVCAPLLWILRHSSVYLSRINCVSSGAIATLDDFDQFAFSQTNQHERGVLNGANVIVRDWFHWKLVQQRQYNRVESEESLTRAWSQALYTFKKMSTQEEMEG